MYAALFLCLCLPQLSKAQAKEDSLKILARSEEWFQLLRYERSFFGLSSYSSAIKDDDFFFSSDGRHDAYSELQKTLEAFRQPLEVFNQVDQHPICRFPARYKWLIKNLGYIGENEKIISMCQAYNKWRSYGRVKSISLYFATGYFGNPASFFGHSLLKFNIKDGDSQLVDTAINYGAITPAQENPVIYVLKGLLGGYSASFSHHDFYFHNHNYSETEMRDLWEYQLNLDPKEVEYIVDHTWEILGKKHPYFFLVDNCAYRMAELLEQVFGKRLLFRNRLYVLPIDLFTNLAQGQRLDGRPMVNRIVRISSRYSRLVDTYSILDKSEKEIMKNIIEKPEYTKSQDFAAVSGNKKSRILETLVNYYSYRKLKDPESHKFDEIRVNLIRERFKVPEKSGFETLSSEVISPEQAQNSFNIQLANVYSKEMSWFQEFNIRPALYDELNPAVGHPPHTSLVVMDIRLRLQEKKLYLRNLDLFRISTLNAPGTDLPGDSQLSWRVQMGLKSQAQMCRDCLVGYFSGGIGKSLKVHQNMDIYGLVKSTVQSNKNEQGTISVGPEIGGFIEPFDWWKLFFSYEHEAFQNELKDQVDIWKFEQRFGNSANWDFRLEYQHRDDKQVRLNLNLYL